jgi:hypothetical protein
MVVRRVLVAVVMVVVGSLAPAACGPFGDGEEDEVKDVAANGRERSGVGAAGTAAFEAELRADGLSESVIDCVIEELDVAGASVRELESPEFLDDARAAGAKCAAD